ncbi:uncharacterized protein LOC114359832 [Ostrinia furnacalis]|uniref:uncharacterized protein LOC114359832 n=1 Tax=Ostrinia furnacalis TaxID=93504 RepID=UPI00103E5307|nr:uncharacterized protein LOC114359832 [Ostrinia furnacalis]XP_028170147.1 uncharacterized protein LOC114359832 [Ostrinia furnacalis]
MDVIPPDPPDPPDQAAPMELSQPLFSQSATKRRLDTTGDSEPAKRTNTDGSLPQINQQVYTHPSLVIAPKTYSDQDKGPFLVHVSHMETDPSSPVFIQPMRFGKFLVTNRIQGIVLDGVKKIGRNRISVEFVSPSAANNFLNNEILPLYKYVASIPTYNVTRMGLIRNIPTDWTMEELAETLTTPDGCGILLKARRLNRKQVRDGQSSWVPTQTVVVTFKGQVLPQRIFCCHNSIPVETYQLPTIQCLNCCRFGHVKAQCRSKPRCYRCTQPHPAEECDVSEGKATCVNCLGPHFAVNKSCPEHSRQKAIKITMSQDNISYSEASSQFQPVRKSYADATKSPSSQSISPTFQLSQPLSPSSSQTISYRKSIPRTPRSHAPLDKGYDKQAHQAIIGNCASSLPNGCALNSGSSPSSSPGDEGLLEMVLSLIISIISSRKIALPSNVAQMLSQISQITDINNGQKGSSMELPKH